MKLATLRRTLLLAVRATILLLLPAFAQAQSLSDGIDVINVNDWGSGHIVTMHYIITDEDVALDQIRDWRVEIDYTGQGQLTGAYMSNYSGTVNSGDIAPDGGFAISNEGVGYRPELDSGYALTFNLQVQGNGFSETDYAVNFVNLTLLPTNTFTSTLVNVNDWYNPSWGGGFNATYRCDVGGPDAQVGPVTDLLIEFNYTGSGTPSNAWTQSHNGPITHGFIAPDGGYAISNLTGFQPELYAGDSVTFAIQVQNAGFSESDFGIACSSGGSTTTTNTAPLASSQSVVAQYDTPLSIELLGSDADNDPLSFKIVSQPTNGSLSGSAPALVYMPAVDFVGTDSFTFVSNDGQIDSAIATFSITVEDGPNSTPTANPQALSVIEGSSLPIELTGVDADNDTLAFQIVQAPANGTLTGTPPFIEYLPDSGFIGSDTVTFTVNDATDTSTTATISISVLPIPNTAPVANAGEDYQAELSQLALVQGNGSDAEDDALTFSWELISKPLESNVSPTLIELQSFEFVPDIAGEYTFQLTVSDGILSSEPDDLTVTATQSNRPPVAIAGNDTTSELGVIVALDGSGTDPDQDALTFQWIQIDGPETVSLSPDTTNATPEFVPSIAGLYVFELTVNDGELTSASDQVQILVVEPVGNNTAPVADAGDDQDIPTNVTVTLIGNGYDADGDEISYAWSLLSSPAGSQSTPEVLLDNVIEFTPDLIGSYRLGLSVNDGQVDSLIDIVQIEASTQNLAPVANATFFSQLDQFEREGFFLDATASYDTDYGDNSHQRLTYTWTILQPTDPNQYQLEIQSNSDEGNSSDGFSGFLAINYGTDVLISLVASDGYQNSEPFLLEIPSGATTPPIIVTDTSLEGVVGGSIILPVSIAEAPNRSTGFNILPAPDAYQVTWELLAQPELSSTELTTISQLISRVEPANRFDLEIQLLQLEFSPLKRTDPDAWQAQYDQLLAEINGASGQSSIALDRPGRYVVRVTADNLRPQGQTSRIIEILAETPGNRQPTARVTNSSPQTVIVDANRSVVSLDGLSSDDADGDPLTYEWRINELPYTSRAYLVDSSSPVTELVVDRRGSYTLSLVVDDGQRRSDAVEFVVNAQGSSPNTAPIAVAGTYANVPSRTFIQLDGYLSSDSDGDPLRYQWRNVSTGDLQNARVSQRNENFSSASVYASQPGEYEFELTVADWSLSSEPVRVIVTVVPANTPPIANNGFNPGQTPILKVGETLTLNADRSYDVEGEPLSYQWSARRLGGGDVQPQTPEASQTAITFSQAGEYFVTLLVSDGELFDTDSVKVTVFADPNQAPVTVFPGTVTADVGQSIFLDGTGSYDPDGDRILLLRPTLRRGPANSQIYAFARKFDEVELASDIKGVFLVSLAHTDTQATSIPALITFAVGNPKPIAKISAPSQAAAGDEITVSGTRSTDSNGFDQLSYVFSGGSLGFNWSLISKPSGSSAVLDSPLKSRPTIMTDLPGDYVFELQIDDFFTSSNPVQHTITVQELVNEPPIAVITGDTSVLPGVATRLDGTGSTDLDGDVLSYEWSVVGSPAGSAPEIEVLGPGNVFFISDLPGLYDVQLVVSDQYVSDTTTISVSVQGNEPPIANAGPDVSASVGETIVFNGDLSSAPNNATLNYLWSIVSKPASSTAVLTSADTVTTSLQADSEGDYIISVRVSYDGVYSQEDLVTVNVIANTNTRPISRIESDPIDRYVGATLFIDGATSSSSNSLPLSYEWTVLNKPQQSTLAITIPSAATQTLVLDKVGDYIFQLIVNDGTQNSSPSTITATILNRDPEAIFSLPTTAFVGNEILLDGSASSDPDGSSLTYSWAFGQIPADSTVQVLSTESPVTSFVPDEQGSYAVTLEVTDLNGLSTSSTNTIDVSNIPANNVKPEAYAGYDQTLLVETAVQLYGGFSYDEENAPLTYEWTLKNLPSGSTAAISNTALYDPVIEIDIEGTYSIELVVNDGVEDSDVSRIVLTAVSLPNNVPPDPGGAGRATIFGTDLDSDGIRDDVQRYIYANYGTEGNLVNVLFQRVRSILYLLENVNQPDVANVVIDNIVRTEECYAHLFPEDVDDDLRIVFAETMNTLERSEEYADYIALFEGQTILLNPINSWEASCDFEVTQ